MIINLLKGFEKGVFLNVKPFFVVYLEFDHDRIDDSDLFFRFFSFPLIRQLYKEFDHIIKVLQNILIILIDFNNLIF
jgi:hypothetical protein